MAFVSRGEDGDQASAVAKADLARTTSTRGRWALTAGARFLWGVRLFPGAAAPGNPG